MLNFPTPSPSGVYKKVIEAGLKKYPKRAQNYKSYLENSKSAKIFHLPIKIDIEPTSKCNLRCHMCIVSTIGYKGTNLSFEEYKKIVDEQVGVMELKIQGLGEPFLNKDFSKMVQYASNRLIWTRSTTNATILHESENYKKIIDANIGELQISVDGTKKTTYEKIRINADFDIVKKNCQLINSYQKQKNVQKTRMWTLLQRDNIEDLFDFPYFAKELGFDRATISMDVNGWGDDEWSKINEEKKVNLTQEDIDNLLDIAKKINLDLTFWDIAAKYNRTNICQWPFSRCMISADSKVVPCCIVSDPKIFNFGDVNNFKNIWFEGYNSFRENHLSGDIVPDICKSCYVKDEEYER